MNSNDASPALRPARRAVLNLFSEVLGYSQMCNFINFGTFNDIQAARSGTYEQSGNTDVHLEECYTFSTSININDFLDGFAQSCSKSHSCALWRAMLNLFNRVENRDVIFSSKVINIGMSSFRHF